MRRSRLQPIGIPRQQCVDPGVWHRHLHPPSHTAAITGRNQRLLKPHSPNDCTACRQQVATPLPSALLHRAVTPWREQKSRRGAPKRITTQGFACPNRTCMYYRITDAHVHALVGDGAEGKAERVQTLRCQACRATISTRRDTPLYRLKTASHRVAEVLSALSEGLDVSAATRLLQSQHRPCAASMRNCSPHGAGEVATADEHAHRGRDRLVDWL